LAAQAGWDTVGGLQIEVFADCAMSQFQARIAASKRREIKRWTRSTGRKLNDPPDFQDRL